MIKEESKLIQKDESIEKDNSVVIFIKRRILRRKKVNLRV